MSYPRFTVAQEKRRTDVIAGTVYHAETGSGGVADNGELNLIFQTNDRDGDALTVNAIAGGSALLSIGTVSSINVAGTGEPLRNFNRVIGEASVTASVTAQGSCTGFDAFFNVFFGSQGPGSNGGGGGEGFTFVLPNSTIFHAKLTNLSGVATNLNLEVEWATIGD